MKVYFSFLQERKKRQEELDRLKQEELLKKQQVSWQLYFYSTWFSIKLAFSLQYSGEREAASGSNSSQRTGTGSYENMLCFFSFRFGLARP